MEDNNDLDLRQEDKELILALVLQLGYDDFCFNQMEQATKRIGIHNGLGGYRLLNKYRCVINNRDTKLPWTRAQQIYQIDKNAVELLFKEKQDETNKHG